MKTKIFKDANIDLSVIRDKKVGVVGFGNQGKAQALNLKDSGVDVAVGVRDNSQSISLLKKYDIKYFPIDKLVKNVDIVSMLVPDSKMESVYSALIHDNLSNGQTLLFSHGYNIHYKLINPPKNINVAMVAPSGGGQLLRDKFKAGSGIPALLAIHNDYSGDTLEVIKSYSKAIGSSRICSFLSSFKEETETDLYGEQALLTGSIPLSIEKSLKVLLEHGYSPIVAWFVCYYEAKMILDLFHDKGIDYLYSAISDTARYGGLKSGNYLIDDDYEIKLHNILKNIKSGAFKKDLENNVNSLKFNSTIDKSSLKEIEKIKKILFSKNNN